MRRGKCAHAHSRSRAHAVAAKRVAALLALLPATAALAASYPAPLEADFVIRDFHFASGESLPQLRIHYRTLGQPRTDAHGVVRNAVLILHGTGGERREPGA